MSPLRSESAATWHRGSATGLLAFVALVKLDETAPQIVLQGVKGSTGASGRQQGILDFCGCGISPFLVTAKGKCLFSFFSLA